jgi:hypothetical protein
MRHRTIVGAAGAAPRMLQYLRGSGDIDLPKSARLRTLRYLTRQRVLV